MGSLESEYNFLEGGGDMGKLIRAKDWSKTPLGAPETWPQSLRIAVRLMLDSPFGKYIAWGSDYIQLYNDGYRPILGATKHPEALGIGTKTTFAEIWSTIGPMFEGVMQGKPIGFPDFVLQLDRNGYMEECVFDFSYSPIRLEDGEVGGVLVTVIETTEKVNNFKKLAESKEQLNFAIDAAELATWEYNPQTNKLIGSHRFNDWFGFAHDKEMDGSQVLEVIIEQDRSHVSDALQKALQYESGGKYDTEYTIINAATKKKRIVKAKGRVSFGDDKLAYRFNGTLQDITEQAIVRKQLESSEKRFSNILSQSIMAIGILEGPNSIITFANDSLLVMWGKGKNVIGMPLLEVLPEIKDQGFPELINDVFTTGEPYEAFETKAIFIRNGIPEEAYFNFMFQPYRDIDNTIAGITVFATEVTEQVLAKIEIEAKQEHLKLLSNTVPALIFYLDKDYHFISVNNQFTSWFGVQSQDVIGLTIQEFVGEDAWDIIRPQLKKAYAGETVDYEVQVPYKLGGTRWTHPLYTPHKNADGHVVGMVVHISDITESKQQEETLRYSKALLEAHNESNRDGLLLVDGKGKIISYNQSFMDVWCMPKEIAESKDDELALQFAMSQLVNPQQFIDKVKWLYEHPSETSIDQLEFLDGRIIERHGYCVMGEDGTYYAWSWTFRDITSQKAAAAAIIESENQFRTFADSIPSLAWIANADGWRYWYNQKWYEYTGTTFEEMKGWGWEKIHHPDYVDRVVTFLKEAFNKEKAFELTIPLRRHDGEYRWFLTRAFPVKDASGTIERWIGTNTDITEQKSFTDELELKVKERTQDLLEKNAQLEHTNAQLTSFSYISSHDLQEPLRKIQMFSSRILETEYDALSENGKNYFQRMQRSALRMQNLIEDLITYFKTNVEETKFETIDFNDIIKDVKETLIEELEEKDITFILKDICEIKIIPIQFTQVLLNLVSNAIKFAKADQPIVIEIECKKVNGKNTGIESLSGDQHFIHIRISDNGIGFEPQYNEKIFEVFQRLHGRESYTGTGMGLAIVKRIIENHYGVIRANGRINEGASFDIYIPV